MRLLLSLAAFALVALPLSALAIEAYYIYADHLDTPRLIENQTRQVVWRWDNDDPFGGNIANANPGGLGTFEFNLRFPGQYFDKETNLHYNYYRDYSPEIGRYIESDPIGLEGGLNTYAYVEGNPLSKNDPKGLQASNETQNSFNGRVDVCYVQCPLFQTIGGAGAPTMCIYRCFGWSKQFFIFNPPLGVCPVSIPERGLS